MEDERGGDAEGAKEMWAANWVKKMWIEMGCFQRCGRECSRDGELFLFKGEERRKKGNNSHFLSLSPHL